MKGKKGWKWGRTMGIILGWLAGALLASEVALRLWGPGPWVPSRHTTDVRPGGHFFRTHPRYGFLPLPGTFDLRLDDQLDWSTRHDSIGFRETAPDTFGPGTPEVWIFGCSFTYGWGVENDSTWVAGLQRRFPRVRFRNFGVPGWGTYQALLLFRDQLAAHVPAGVVVGYADFQDQRNVASRFWKKALAGQPLLEGLRVPCLRPVAESWEETEDSLWYRPWPLQGWSALVHLFEIQACKSEEARRDGRGASLFVLGEFRKKCEEEGIPLVVVGVNSSPDTRERLGVLARSGCDTLGIGQPDAWRILPNDAHPDSRAHRRWLRNSAITWPSEPVGPKSWTPAPSLSISLDSDPNPSEFSPCEP